MSNNWDVIILGLGGAGSAAAYHCGLMGLRVLGIDQFEPAHNQGSSHGHTRVIRQAYFEHADYIPLLGRAYELWDQLENESDEKLFHRSGLVQVGPADGLVIPRVIHSATEHDLEIEQLSMRELNERWPGLRGADDWLAVVETNAGFLRVESCVAAHLRLAQANGVVCRHHVRVASWRVDGSGIEVQTENSVERCQKLLIAAGAWSGNLLRQYGVPLQVLRKYQYWFDPKSDRCDAQNGFPCFFFETPAGYYYGVPNVVEGGVASGVKVARHSGGLPLSNASPPEIDIDEEDLSLVQSFHSAHLPDLSQSSKNTAGCYYTVTPDEHFLIDQLPDNPAVTVVAGLSGHGFKFTCVLGEIAATLVGGKARPAGLELFQMSRFTDQQ